jgi:hypothetical protein
MNTFYVVQKLGPFRCWQSKLCISVMTFCFIFQLAEMGGRNIFAAENGIIAGFSLSGSLPDGVGQEGLLGDVSPQLSRFLQRLEKAAKDESVRGVLLSIQSPQLGRARVSELRDSIQHVRAAGKPIVAHLISGEPLDYSVAAA